MTRKVIGMRRGKQFDFVKVERPEKEDHNQGTANVKSGSTLDERGMKIEVERLSCSSSAGL